MKNKIIFILLFSSVLQGQKISNVIFAQVGNQVIVTYDLTHSDNSLIYEVVLLHSVGGG